MPATSGTSKYIVIAGDSLWKIAKNQCGNANLWREIARWNGLSRPFAIFVGQGLIIPARVHPSQQQAHHSAFQDIAEHYAQLLAKRVLNPHFTLHLEGTVARVQTPTWEATLKLHGEIAFTREGDAPFDAEGNLQDRSIELSREAQTAANGVESKTSVTVTPKSFEIGFGVENKDGPLGFAASEVKFDPVSSSFSYSLAMTSFGPYYIGVTRIEGEIGFELEVKRKPDWEVLSKMLQAELVAQLRKIPLEADEPPDLTHVIARFPLKSTIHWAPYIWAAALLAAAADAVPALLAL